jgi:polyhydroxyalkanoate synthesis repressor PhaR
MTVIKRYSNRKLYDTDARRYVTLDEIAEAVRRGEEVRVVDHVTGENLTTLTLLQVLFEQEKKLGGLLPQAVLSRMIQTGGDALKGLRGALIAAFDLEQRVEDEIARRLQRLVEQGLLSDAEAARLSELLRMAGRKRPSEPQVAPEEVAAEEEDIPTRAAVEDLRLEVAALEEEINALKKARGKMQLVSRDQLFESRE